MNRNKTSFSLVDVGAVEMRMHHKYFASIIDQDPALFVARLGEFADGEMKLSDHHSNSVIFTASTRAISFLVKINLGQDNETRAIQLLYDKVVQPGHIAPIIANVWFEIRFKTIPIMPDSPQWMQELEKKRHGKGDPYVVKCMEEYRMTLAEYLKRKIHWTIESEMLRGLICLLLHGMAGIVERVPDFRHGDLHMNNIMLQFVDGWLYQPDIPEYIQLTMDGSDWYVPFLGVMPKIIDYDYASSAKWKIEAVDTTNVPLDIANSDVYRLLYNLFMSSSEIIHGIVRSMGTWTTAFNCSNEKDIRKCLIPAPNTLEILRSTAFADYRIVPRHGVVVRRYGAGIASE